MNITDHQTNYNELKDIVEKSRTLGTVDLHELYNLTNSIMVKKMDITVDLFQDMLNKARTYKSDDLGILALLSYNAYYNTTDVYSFVTKKIYTEKVYLDKNYGPFIYFICTEFIYLEQFA